MGRGTLELRNASPSAEIRFEVLESFDATGQWLDEVCKASDAHRNELGFLARSIFEQFARREGLYVLLAHTPTGPQYAGHLLFDRHFPRAHVRQMFTLEPFRRFGAASQLLDHLRQSLTQSCFISIYARVAEDLIGANAFWHKQRFYVQRSVKGGATRNRQTLVRCHELDSPQLFPTSGLNDHNPLGLVEPAANELPMYLLDMNVLFDVQPRRLRRAEVVGLFQAERMNFCRLAISSEIRDELQRNLQSRHTDPMEAYIETFPCLPVDQPDETDGTFSKLATLIFPQAVGHRPLTSGLIFATSLPRFSTIWRASSPTIQPCWLRRRKLSKPTGSKFYHQGPSSSKNRRYAAMKRLKPQKKKRFAYFRSPPMQSPPYELF